MRLVLKIQRIFRKRSSFKQFTIFMMGLVTLSILTPSALAVYVPSQNLAVTVLAVTAIFLGFLGALWLVLRIFRTISDWAYNSRSLNGGPAASLTPSGLGEPVSLVCPRCGILNLPGHRFCSSCGNPLTSVV